jgi:hypothetical protein
VLYWGFLVLVMLLIDMVVSVGRCRCFVLVSMLRGQVDLILTPESVATSHKW